MDEIKNLHNLDTAPDAEHTEFYETAVLIKQSLTSEMTDEEMGMPDIEEEMQRIAAAAQPQVIPLRPQSNNRFRHIAASVAAFLVISALAYAAVHITRYYRQQSPQPTAPVIEQRLDTVVTVPPVEQEEEDSVEVLFDNATLSDMLQSISKHYGMKVQFANEKLKSIRLYYYFNKTKSVDKAIRDLNHFNKMSITRDEKTIFVDEKPKQ